MQPIHCEGIIKTGNLAGKRCKKFLGELTAPYRVCCSRCGTWNESDPKGDATENGRQQTESREARHE